MNGDVHVYIIADIAVFLSLAVAKTVSFTKATRHKTLSNWLFFNSFSIINSPTQALSKAKTRQNNWSTALLLYAVFSTIVFLFVK